MKMVCCAIHDSAIDAFMRPMFVPKSGMAVRMFMDEVRRKDSEMCKHPTDYSLHEIGVWDEETGKFENVGPKLLIRGADCVEVKS